MRNFVLIVAASILQYVSSPPNPLIPRRLRKVLVKGCKDCSTLNLSLSSRQMHLAPRKFWVKVIVSICEISLTAHHATAILSLVIVINSEYQLCYQHTIKILTSLTHRALPIWTNIIPTTTKRQSPFTRLLLSSITYLSFIYLSIISCISQL